MLSTHINADGDGCGSEAALARLLSGAGLSPRIVNPTPWPGAFAFLRGHLDDQTARGAGALTGADVLIVVDISDVRRLGVLTDAVRALAVPKLVIDHHLPGEEPPGSLILSDTTACATGELVFDLAMTLGWPIDREAAAAMYVALLTDTGGFRFSNTTPRCHAIAGYLLTLGVEPEEMYRSVYASVPVGRLQILREALANLEVDAAHAIAWISLPAGRRRAVRADVGGPRGDRRASALDRGHATGALLSRSRAREGQGLFPQHGGCGCEPVRTAVRRRRPCAGRGGADRGPLR